MMGLEAHQKVRADHLKRDAYLYIRQSTLRQVIENTESTKRQYNLGDHAVALGWPIERLVVIDNDLGQSGASAVDTLEAHGSFRTTFVKQKASSLARQSARASVES
jgi:DNA invertase Pin-like site-specific DNA recombinase